MWSVNSQAPEERRFTLLNDLPVIGTQVACDHLSHVVVIYDAVTRTSVVVIVAAANDSLGVSAKLCGPSSARMLLTGKMAIVSESCEVGGTSSLVEAFIVITIGGVGNGRRGSGSGDQSSGSSGNGDGSGDDSDNSGRGGSGNGDQSSGSSGNGDGSGDDSDNSGRGGGDGGDHSSGDSGDGSGDGSGDSGDSGGGGGGGGDHSSGRPGDGSRGGRRNRYMYVNC